MEDIQHATVGAAVADELVQRAASRQNFKTVTWP